MTKINISEEERKLIILKISRWMVKNNMSFGKASKEFDIPKTTLKRWFYKYVESLDADLYNEMLKLLSSNSKKNIDRKLKANEETLRFARFILDYPQTLPLYKYFEIYDKKISRRNMTKKLYYQLFDLDKTEDKSLYFGVMNKLKISTNSVSKIPAVIDESLNKLERMQKEANIYNEENIYSDIEIKIINCAKILIKKEKTIDELASIYETDVANIEIALREVLPMIDVDLYNQLRNIYYPDDSKILVYKR